MCPLERRGKVIQEDRGVAASDMLSDLKKKKEKQGQTSIKQNITQIDGKLGSRLGAVLGPFLSWKEAILVQDLQDLTQ